MTQERTFTFELKNDQTITLKFSPIEATGNRLWQMFATTEALDTVDLIIKSSVPVETKKVVKDKPIVTEPIPNPAAKNKKNK
jgi:hypothetical protein